MELTVKQKAHRAYLRSDHWKGLRDAALARDKYRCVGCGCGEQLEVHHEVYRGRFEDGILEDVVTLCRRCHRVTHGRWVESRREFDVVIKGVRRKLDLMQTLGDLPDRETQVRLCQLCETRKDCLEMETLFRIIATSRIVLAHSSARWESWLDKPPEVRGRLWDWAEKKLIRLTMKGGDYLRQIV